MFKVLLLCCLLGSVFAELWQTSLVEVKDATKTHIREPGWIYTFQEGFNSKSLRIPSDDGRSNYGDLLHGYRDSNDYLLTREIQINTISGADQTLRWTGSFPGKRITHIRFLNVGRQRGFTNYIRQEPGSSYAEAEVIVARNLQFRLMIEVYGY